MGFELRTTAATDDPALDALLDDVASGELPVARWRQLHGSAVGSPRVRRSFVAVDDDGLIIGVGTARSSNRHPRRNQLLIHVHPDSRRTGVATALLDQVASSMARAGHDKPFVVATDDDDATGRAFLEGRGFRRLMGTRVGTVELGALGPSANALPDGYRIEAVADIAAIEELYETLFDELHWWHQPYIRNHGGQSWLSFLRPALAGATFVAVDPWGEQCGAVSVHGDRDADTAFLAPPSVLRAGRRPGSDALAQGLVDHAVARARELGIERLRWALDESAIEFAAVVATWPVDPAERRSSLFATAG